MQDLERHDVQQLMEKGAQVVDVLPRDEFDEDHLPGAVSIPLRNIDTDAETKLDKEKPVIVYCWDSA
jgi:rhodanese-related sulfurtransferase